MVVAIPLFFGFVCMILLANKKFSISWIFVFMWTVCLSLSCLGLYGINKPTFTVIILSCVSMLVFTFASFLKYPILKIGSKDYHTDIGFSKPPTRRLLIYIFNILAYVFSLPYLKKSLNIMITKGAAYLRYVSFDGDGGLGSTAVLMIFQYVISSLFLATIIATAIDIFDGKVNPLSVVFSILDVLLYTVLFAGRFTILNFAIIISFAAVDTGKVRSVMGIIKKHKKLIFFVGIMILCLCVMTSLRSSKSIIKSVYIYFAGSFSYLSYLINEEVGTDLFLLGKTFWGFIYNTIYSVLTVFFGVKYNGSNHIITELTGGMVPIGGGNSFNALGTMLHDFICDLGVYGSLLEVFLFALICNYVERIRILNDSYFSRAVYYYMVLSVVYSVFHYQFRGPGALFCFIFLFLFCRQNKC